MQKRMIYVAAAAMLLSTTGCVDKVVQQAKDWCGGLCKKEAAAPEAKSDDKGEEASEAKDEPRLKSLSAEAVKNELETDDTVLLINVLAKKYYDDCHIVGSVNMPFDSIEKDIQGVPHDAKIILYCANATCPVSHKAAERLERLGYVNVRLYEGGMKEWFDLGFPSDGPAEEEYLKKGK